jgi:hypothetical protein
LTQGPHTIARSVVFSGAAKLILRRPVLADAGHHGRATRVTVQEATN